MPKPSSPLAGILIGAAVLAACQPMAENPAPGATPAPAPAERRDDDSLAFAQGACGGCHAVEAPYLSPNPQAPPFAAIANREGLTAETLGRWLRDAHNYPEEMDFDLDPAQVDMLVAYMLRLQDEAYRPLPS